MDVSKGVYLSGFARGGTTWARQILCAHPNVFEVGKQVGFKAPLSVTFDKAHIEDKIIKMLNTFPDTQTHIQAIENSPKFAVKSPPNALILSEMMDIMPDAKHVFIIRDPRDVLVSHQRTGAAWTEAHRNFDMAVERTATFYNGYEKAKGRDGLMLFRYEDAHQKFPSTFKRLCEFMELDIDDNLINTAMQKLSFRAVTGRSHEERPGMNRRGVAGDWVKNLSWADGHRFKQSEYWTRVMTEHGYDWQLTSVQGIVKAASQAELDGCTLQADKPGAHMLWSLSDSQWDNMEAVIGILRRCRQGVKLSHDNGFPTTMMLAGEIPERSIRALSNAIKKTPVALEVNLDTLPQAPGKFTKNLEELIKTTLPSLSALNESAEDHENIQAVVFGESWELYELAKEVLAKHGIEAISLQNPDADLTNSISWLLCDSANTLTMYGSAEGFDPLQADSWRLQKNGITYIVAKLTVSSVQDPLSLGFRTCFNDVQSMA